MNRIFKVGGCVRDVLMGRGPKDIDFSVEAPSFDAMRQLILDKGGKIFLETPECFTIRAKVPNLGAADFVLCRKESAYRDGRRPETVEVGTLFDDLARRDFKMNAIAVDAETGEMFDPHNGKLDIADRIISCVGDPHQRFTEDKLRIFRALRFHVTLGFGIWPSTQDAMLDISEEGDFSAVSTERIREELGEMCAEDCWKTLAALKHFHLENLVRERGIWFKPTLGKA